ncbi:MAG: helix-turn-helix transcriptional regulator [Alphaproteobacteria bacterium]|nr:helix-turn-helix transcriptional regulator [Alphaproteobacteria bacterium]
MAIDYDALATQVVVELQGTQPARAVSRRLGRSAATVHRWTQGSRPPPADDVLLLAHLKGRDVLGAVCSLTNLAADTLGDAEPRDPAFTARIVEAYAASYTQAGVAERTGLSRHQVGRMARGETRIRLADLLRVLQECNRALVDFLAVVSDLTQLPAVEEAWLERDRMHALYRDMPLIGSLLNALSRPAYRALPGHDPAWLAELVGLSPDDVTRALARAEGLSLVRREGAHLVETIPHTDMRLKLPPTLAREVAASLTREAATRLEQHTATCAWAVLMPKDEDIPAMAHALSKGLDEAMRVGNAGGGYRLMYAMVHLVAVDGTPVMVRSEG